MWQTYRHVCATLTLCFSFYHYVVATLATFQQKNIKHTPLSLYAIFDRSEGYQIAKNPSAFESGLGFWPDVEKV